MEITYRAGTIDDSYPIFEILGDAVADLIKRFGASETTPPPDPDDVATYWDLRRPMFEHLAKTAYQFCVAERDGKMVGFARSILEDDLMELTEFFVLPESQSLGVGRELISRVFPKDAATHKLIIATADLRAQTAYIKQGLLPRFPIYYFEKSPEPAEFQSDLEFVPLDSRVEGEVLSSIDKAIIGHRRNHNWFLTNRQGYLYYRDKQPIGYGYVGKQSGPFALLNQSDFPAVLAHAETEAAKQNLETFGLEVPTINYTVVDYLAARGFKPDSFMAVLMSNVPFGKFENYIVTSPPFFL